MSARSSATSAQVRPFILASASPRRRELLRGLGIDFRVEVAPVEEWEPAEADPAQMVAQNAAHKAAAVAAVWPEARVLGADTTVALDGQLLHKPADLAEARRMLHRLSGRRHEVFTSVSLQCRAEGLERTFVEQSAVLFRDLDEPTIEAYFSVVDPLDKAGAYGIQEGRELIIATYIGSLTNIMGLPVERLERELRELGWWPLS